MSWIVEGTRPNSNVELLEEKRRRPSGSWLSARCPNGLFAVTRGSSTITETVQYSSRYLSTMQNWLKYTEVENGIVL